MNEDVSIEEVLNNSFATIYDVLKLVDSSVNDIVIKNLNNDASADEILRLQQFNVDYIKAMQETKALQSNIMGLFNYVGKDLNELKQADLENVNENVDNVEMNNEVTNDNPQEVVEEESVDEDVNMITPDEINEEVTENTEEIEDNQDIELPNVETPEDIVENVADEQTEEVTEQVENAEVELPSEENIEEVPENAVQTDAVIDAEPAAQVEETPVTEEVQLPDVEVPTEGVVPETQPVEGEVQLPTAENTEVVAEQPEGEVQLPTAEVSTEGVVPETQPVEGEIQLPAVENTEVVAEQPAAEQPVVGDVQIPIVAGETPEAVAEQPTENAEVAPEATPNPAAPVVETPEAGVGLPVIPVVGEQPQAEGTEPQAEQAAETPVDAQVAPEQPVAGIPNITFNTDQPTEAPAPETPAAEAPQPEATVNQNVVLPTIPTVAEPQAETTEQSVEQAETNENNELVKYYRTSDENPRVILVTNPQNDKLKQSLDAKKALLNAKGFFISDANLEEQLVQNGMLEGSVEDKQKQVQQLMEEAKALYPTDPNAAQEKMNQVAVLNEEIKNSTPQQQLVA